MSADNYYRVKKLATDRYEVSMRFASSYYEDEIDPENLPLAEARYTGTEPVDESGFAPIPKDWISPAPSGRIFATFEEADAYAHGEYSEYGVSYSFPIRRVEA